MSVASLQPRPSRALSPEGSNDAASHLRPNIIRRDTDNILSYYQSEHAGRTYTALDAGIAPTPSIMKEGSPYSESRSSSEYSSDSSLSLDDHVTASSHGKRLRLGTDSESGHTRRPSVPSEGGADRRRLAIVELDSNVSSSLARKRSQAAKANTNVPMGSTIHSRRGMHVEGLALVAPPDASPRTYTDLTPPSTAPLSMDRAPVPSLPASHQRSMSEAVTATGKSRHQHKSSRDVGIVGMVSSISETLEKGASTRGDDHTGYAGGQSLKVPIFQTPTESRSPPPGRTPEASESSTLDVLSASSSALTTPDYEKRQPDILTPAIGESKDISQPVVGPVVVGISADMMRTHPAREGPYNTTIPSPGMMSPGDVFAPRQSSHTRSGSPYIHYEPGLHSTAGPLPPPPQPIVDVNTLTVSATPAPPRPPRAFTPLPSAGISTRRDVQALKEALQLPKSVSTALASITPPTERGLSRSELREGSVHSREGTQVDDRPSRPLTKSRSLHVREGAHPPSTVTNSPVLPDDTVDENTTPTVAASSSTAEHGTSDGEEGSLPPPEHLLRKGRSGIELRRGNSWVSLDQEQGQRAFSPNGGTEHLPRVSISRSSTSSSTTFSHIPPPPPKSFRYSPATDDERSPPVASASGSNSNPLRGALTNLKRFSALPRTPSVTSTVAKSKSPSPRHSRTPSPQVIPPQNIAVQRKPRPVSRVKSAWPDAMQCRDVMSKKTALERSKGYADKINELAMYDCGLADWVKARQHPRPTVRTTQTSAVRLTLTPATPSSRAFVEQPRHTSDGSTASEMTFPIRPDAYIATDLTTRAIDVVPPNAPPPTLPYPSLAQVQSSRSPMRSTLMLSPSPSRNLLTLPGSRGSGGGFFASIGRKSSVKKDRPTLSSVSPSRVLSKRNPSVSATSRPPPVQVVTAPSIPGGPRAAPGRIQRSQTFSAAASPPAAEPTPPPTSNTHPNRQSSMARRPSLFARARGYGQSQAGAAPVAPAPVVMTAEFEQQVDKLADLLPHADRNILGGYLRRAGQDILAIGQYLEDEKNGTLRRD